MSQAVIPSVLQDLIFEHKLFQRPEWQRLTELDRRLINTLSRTDLSAGEKARQYASIIYPYRSVKEDVLVNGRRFTNRKSSNIETANELGDKTRNKVKSMNQEPSSSDVVADESAMSEQGLGEEEEEEEEVGSVKGSISSAASDNPTAIDDNTSLDDVSYESANDGDDDEVFAAPEPVQLIDPFIAMYERILRLYGRSEPTYIPKNIETSIQAFMSIMDPNQTVFPKVIKPSISKARAVRLAIEATQPKYYKRLLETYPSLSTLNTKSTTNERMFSSYVNLAGMDAMTGTAAHANKRGRVPSTEGAADTPEGKTKKPKKVSKYEQDNDYVAPIGGKQPTKPRSPQKPRQGKVDAVAKIRKY